MRVPCFFYGSYMDPSVLRRFGVDAGHGQAAEVNGWRLTFTPHANLIKGAASDAVQGFLYDLTHEDLDKLYGEDGYVTTYGPMPIKARILKGTTAVMTFVEDAPEAAPDAAYVDSFVAICIRLGLPNDYVKELKARATALMRKHMA